MIRTGKKRNSIHSMMILPSWRNIFQTASILYFLFTTYKYMWTLKNELSLILYYPITMTKTCNLFLYWAFQFIWQFCEYKLMYVTDWYQFRWKSGVEISGVTWDKRSNKALWLRDQKSFDTNLRLQGSRKTK